MESPVAHAYTRSSASGKQSTVCAASEHLPIRHRGDEPSPAHVFVRSVALCSIADPENHMSCKISVNAAVADTGSLFNRPAVPQAHYHIRHLHVCATIYTTYKIVTIQFMIPLKPHPAIYLVRRRAIK